MLGNKILKLRNGKITEGARSHSFFHHSHHFTLDPQKIKSAILTGFKKSGYVALFITLKLSIKSLNFIKVKGKKLIIEIERKFQKNKNELLEEVAEKKEVSKYLKTISEYRQKIKLMKYRIKKEEGIK